MYSDFFVKSYSEIIRDILIHFEKYKLKTWTFHL